MRKILPPYGVILRDAIRTGDRDLMQAFVKYSEFLMEKRPDITEGGLADWKAAHEELVKAAG